jgi:hypothetical protein
MRLSQNIFELKKMSFKLINYQEIKSVEEIIDDLKNYEYTLEENILNLDEIISTNQKTDLIENFIEDYKTDYKLKEFNELIGDFYCTDSDFFEADEYFIGHLSIASGLHALNFERVKVEKDYVPLTSESNIYDALVSLYPNPNDFIEKYDLYKFWQDNEYELNAGVLWLDQIVELGFVKGEIYKREVYQKALKNTLKIIKE